MHRWNMGPMIIAMRARKDRATRVAKLQEKGALTAEENQELAKLLEENCEWSEKDQSNFQALLDSQASLYF